MRRLYTEIGARSPTGKKRVVTNLTLVANSRAGRGSAGQMSWCTAHLPYHVVPPYSVCHPKKLRRTAYGVKCRSAMKSSESSSRRGVIANVV